MNSPSPAADVVAVYHGDVCLGEAEVYYPNPNQKSFIPEEKEREREREIRISYLSPPSERCPPLSVLHTISPFPLRCRLRGRSNSPIAHLHHSCFQHRQTAVALIADQELHLVAMPSKLDNAPSFWCCSVRPGMYSSCLAMLNLRCLAIVFDLDETLIVANTMKSFEDRIEALSRWIDAEHDPARISLMSAELKRYLEDRELLKQYIETDSVSDGGRLVRVQNEEVPLIPGAQDRILRPIIRLQEKNIVLTRINPEIRDTSVLVRLRPAWEDLRSYLTAKGRKRFEVYVCTMAERDYALEMWRLLDPEAHLINSKQLLDRVVCVKAGSRKSLLHVFQDGLCHPKMAMVIDDRLKVWEDKDQPRVHVVPAFSPYYAPQLETASAVPILCVARNVACNVRGGFFKEFDENLLRRVFELCYENELLDLPYAPDVSDFLMTEDTGPTLNINKDVPILDGINATEVERRINQQAFIGDEQPVKQQAQPTNSSFTGEDDSVSGNQASSNLHSDAGLMTSLSSSMYIAVLQEIGRRCDYKVDFRTTMGSNNDMQFSVEVLFSNEKIGIGRGKTRKEAQQQAAQNALHNLANNYVSFMGSDARDVGGDLDKLSLGNDNGFLRDNSQDEALMKQNSPKTDASEQLGQLADSKRLSEVLSGIKELCVEGQSPIFQDEAPSSMNLRKHEYYFQVVLAGQILGTGVGSSREEAKLQAAEEAYKFLKESVKLEEQKHFILRSPHVHPTKRPKE